MKLENPKNPYILKSGIAVHGNTEPQHDCPITSFPNIRNSNDDESRTDFLDELRCSVKGELIPIAYHPTFADWLLWLKADEHLLMMTAGNPLNFVWAKALLKRWQEAGYPCPSEWPETRNLDWLRPVHSCWPDVS